MGRSTCFLLIVLFWSGLSNFGQSAPKLRYPRIVATFERLGQTGDISPTTVYVPKNWGTFHVSIVMVGTVANGSDGAWGGGLQFEDGSGSNGPGGPFGAYLQTSMRLTAVAEFPIRAEAGKPLTFSVVSGGNTFGSKYNVWVVVEQLM